MNRFFNEIRKKFGKTEIYTFKGGIHPNDMKKNTKAKPVVDIEAPEELVFVLQQSLGVAAVPCVEVGDRVLAGQKIAQAGGYVSANIHSSVSGTVKAIEQRLHPSGVRMQAIVIENDGLGEESNELKPFEISTITAREIVERVKEAGIVGMGGATFPTHVKLSPPADKKIDYVIINGAECEPYLTSDHRAMLETADEIIAGLKLILKALGLKSGCIAVETNKPDAIARLKECALKVTDAEINIVGVKTKYPQGSEKHLIKAITKRSVPSGKLPLDVGVVVNNIDTCAAVARAVLLGKPLTKRIVTVSGDCIAEPINCRVPIGTSFEYLVRKCGGFTKPAAKLIMGGPMMGIALTELDVPVIKGSSGLLAFSDEMSKFRQAGNCLRCGRCVAACPMKLLPNVIKEAVCTENIEKLSKLNVNDCIQCGSCSYVCPAEQNPLQYIKTGKVKLNKREVKS